MEDFREVDTERIHVYDSVRGPIPAGVSSPLELRGL